MSLAALKLGAKEVIGIDIDPQALQASKDNAIRNGVEDRLSLYLPDNQPDIQADVVVANILAGPLKELAPIITKYIAENGLLALSGILEEQAVGLVDVYGQWCQMDPIVEKEEWVRLSGAKKQ